jgi:glycosyltransferase involved in cell wall biosynthesis
VTTRPRQVHQLLATLSHGDAIGNEALAIQKCLRSAGYESDIFAEGVHPRVARLARPLWDYYSVSSPETVCIFHFSIGSAASPLIFHAPDRLVLIYHNITPPEWFVGYHRLLTQLCYRGRRELAAFAARTDLALGDSEFNRRELEQAGFRTTAVLPIVLDFTTYDAPRSPVVERLYADGRTNVLFVGRVITNKKIDDLIRAFACYQRLFNPHSRLLVVGDYRGQERYLRVLLALVRRLGVEEVVFTGHVEHDELLAYYGLAEVFLCLSEHEGFCVPLVEAMRFGVPVLAYDAGAVRDTLASGGLLLKDKQPQEVAGLIDALARDAALRQAVLATQTQALAVIRTTDFGALLLERLAPVLRGAPRTEARTAQGGSHVRSE